MVVTQAEQVGAQHSQQDPHPPLSAWVGRQQIRRDRLCAGTVLGFEALVRDRQVEAPEGAVAPALIHWLLFHDHVPLIETGPDGHPRRGGFLPPVPAARRMWAGGRLELLRPLRIGAALERRSRVEQVTEKSGRQGPLVLVSIGHEIHDAHGPVLRERQDLVYRDPSPAPAPPTPAPGSAEDAPAGPGGWRRRIEPTPLMLFRYSALTMNGHRIHYDHPYATGVEKYPGLVVHGPLLATFLLTGLAEASAERPVATYSYRAVHPVFATGPFEACGSFHPDGGGGALFIRDTAGRVCMQAEARFAAAEGR